MKTCWMCKHFDYTEGSRGYSEYTPGSNFSMRCGKGHWKFSNETSEKEFVSNFKMANKCKDYEKCKKDW